MNKVLALLMALGLSNFTHAASIGSRGIGTAFSEGSASFGAMIGSGSAFDESYFILGAGIGYYLTQGLELGINAQYWLSGKPSISKITPKITYVFPQVGSSNPYIGTFYRRTFYGEGDISSDASSASDGRIKDQNSYGFRAGAYINTDNQVYIGGGIVYEKYIDCHPLLDCTSISPELIFTVSF